MPATTVDAIREGVLRRMERQATIVRVAMLGAGAVEALMLGLVALGAHLPRACNRVVAVIETIAPR